MASVEPALAFGAQVYSQTPVVLGVLRPHVRMHRQADEACPRAAHKTGAYRNLRFFTLAALVPSAATLRTLKNLIGLVSGVGTRIPLGMGGTRLCGDHLVIDHPGRGIPVSDPQRASQPNNGNYNHTKTEKGKCHD
jgi:hypothetical protein